jgi:hypothetical protein
MWQLRFMILDHQVMAKRDGYRKPVKHQWPFFFLAEANQGSLIGERKIFSCIDLSVFKVVRCIHCFEIVLWPFFVGKGLNKTIWFLTILRFTVKCL